MSGLTWYVCDCGKTRVSVESPAEYPYGDGCQVHCTECGTYVTSYPRAEGPQAGRDPVEYLRQIAEGRFVPLTSPDARELLAALDRRLAEGAR